MVVWALADLHLAFGRPEKTMEVFGPVWKDYPDKIRSNWEKVVGHSDLVVVSGDISWGIDWDEALIDLKWIDELPGKKLFIRGNHDYWWPSSTKLKAHLPPSIHFIHNNAFDWHDYTFGGSRLWDSHEYAFGSFTEIIPNPHAKIPVKEESSEEQERIFLRELHRLRLSLEKLNPCAKKRIAITHYPPIGAELLPSRASAILEEFRIDLCLFGHLHSIHEKGLPFGAARGVKYLLTSADYLGFTPLKVLD